MDADIQKLFDDLAEQKRAEKQKKHEAGIFNALTEPGLKAKKAKIEEESGQKLNPWKIGQELKALGFVQNPGVIFY